MIMYLIGLVTGGFIGMTVMCLCDIMDGIDELDDMTEEEAEEQEEDLPGEPEWEEMDWNI